MSVVLEKHISPITGYSPGNRVLHEASANYCLFVASMGLFPSMLLLFCYAEG